MAYEIYLPKLGANMTEGRIAHWFADEGDAVKVGQRLFELITDKATVEVEAENRGILKKILIPAGTTVPIASTIGIIADENEDVSAVLQDIEKRKHSPKLPETTVADKESEEEKYEPGPATIEIQKMMHTPDIHENAGGIKASPRARRRAKQAGIDLYKIRPSRGDIITHEDVETYILVSGRPRKCVIIGAGQYSRVIREILELEYKGKLEIAGYIDDKTELSGKSIDCLRVLGGTSELNCFSSKGVTHFIVSVGEPHIRATLFKKALKAGLEPISALHPNACISQKACVEEGCVVEANSVVAVNCRIDRGVFITQNCSVSHDCHIGEFSHMAPGSHMGGSVRLGKGVLLGVGASVSPNITIEDNAIITPGTSIDRPVAQGSVVEGCPGRVIGTRSDTTRI